MEKDLKSISRGPAFYLRRNVQDLPGCTECAGHFPQIELKEELKDSGEAWNYYMEMCSSPVFFSFDFDFDFDFDLKSGESYRVILIASSSYIA